MVSRVIVFARNGVLTVCLTTKLVGEFSLMTVRVPSPCELKVYRRWVEYRSVAAYADGQVGDDMAVGGREDDHVVIFPASAEQDVVLGVDSQTGAFAALAG